MKMRLLQLILPVTLICCLHPRFFHAQTLSPDLAVDCTQYSQDSLRFLRLWDKYWAFDDAAKHDSAIAVCQQLIGSGKRLFRCRIDSTIYEKYGKAYAGIGYNLMEKGQYALALEYSTMGLDTITARFGENHIRNTEICVGIAYNYLRRGDFKNAEAWIQKSLYIMTQVFEKNHYYFGNNYANLGAIFFEQGKYRKAIQWFDAAVENFKVSAPKGVPSICLELAKCYMKLDKHEKAAYYLKTGIEGKKKFEGLWHYLKEGQLEVNLAKVYFRQGEIGAAHRTIEKVLNFPLGELSEGVRGDANFLLGEIAREEKQYTNAIRYFKRAIRQWNNFSGDGIVKSVQARQNLASTLFDLGAHEDALQQLQQLIIELCQNFTDPDPNSNPGPAALTPKLELLKVLQLKAGFLEARYTNLRELDYLRRSAETYQTIFSLVEKMRKSYLWDASRGNLMEVASPVLASGMAVNLTLYDLTCQPQYYEQALQFADLNKDAILFDHVYINESLPPAQQEHYDSLNREIGFYRKLLFDSEQNKSRDSVAVLYWENRLTDLTAKMKILVGEAGNNGPAVSKPITLSALQNQLKKGQLLLSFSRTDSSLTVFEVAANQYDFYRIGDLDVLKTRMLSMLQLLESPPAPDAYLSDLHLFQTYAGELFRQLLAPAIEKYSPEQLIIVPDGLLHFLPFDLLLFDPEDNPPTPIKSFRDLPYLLKFSLIRYQTSIRAFLEQEVRSGNGAGYIGFAPSYRGDEISSNSFLLDRVEVEALYGEALRSGITPLQFNQEEVEQVAALTQGRIFRGEEATETAIKQWIPDASVVHLAMHALTNDQAPEFSQFLCYQFPDTLDDGMLYAQEIKQMRLKADLVVLSACFTGAGKVQSGEGVLSLARAFQYAGGKNVVMSLWAANDRSTKEIVHRFFRNLSDHRAVSDALAEAKISYLEESENEYSTHPFFWAGLIAVGEDGKIDWQKPQLSTTWLLTLLLGVMGLMTVFLNRKPSLP